MTAPDGIPTDLDLLRRVVLAYTRPGDETTVTALLETTRPANVVGHPAMTASDLKRALLSLENEGIFARRTFKTITFWRRADHAAADH